MDANPNATSEIRPEDLVPEGVIRARAAFLRDFPKLHADKKTRGKYVCYHNDELVLVNKSYPALRDEFYARDLPENASIVAQVTLAAEERQRAIFDEAELP